MQRKTLLKTTLAVSIALASFMGLAGCDWGHHDDHPHDTPDNR